MVFTNLNFAGFGDENWSRIAVKELEEDVAAGAVGLKIYKSLGLSVADIDGNRVPGGSSGFGSCLGQSR